MWLKYSSCKLSSEIEYAHAQASVRYHKWGVTEMHLAMGISSSEKFFEDLHAQVSIPVHSEQCLETVCMF